MAAQDRWRCSSIEAVVQLLMILIVDLSSQFVRSLHRRCLSYDRRLSYPPLESRPLPNNRRRGSTMSKERQSWCLLHEYITVDYVEQAAGLSSLAAA
jgi:hypothetical protein